MKEVKAHLLMEKLSHVTSQVFIETIALDLAKYDDDCFEVLMAKKYKSGVVAVLLALFLGAYGAGRFYVSDVGLGIARLVCTFVALFLTFINVFLGVIAYVGLMIWQIVDIFLVYKKAKAYNESTIRYYLSTHVPRNASGN